MQKTGTQSDLSHQLTIFNKIVHKHMIEISLSWANEYQKNPKNLISTLKKFKSMRTIAWYIVYAYKHEKIFDECKASGKDFSNYAMANFAPDDAQNIADLLLIIYSITNHEKNL
jgi:hypothetical protein